MPRAETLTSSDSDSENEKKIKQKLRKEKGNKRKSTHAPESTASKKPASSGSIKATVNSEENEKIFLGKMKFVSVRPFKNMVLIDIREHYEKDGELKPGKKGISLQAEQWQRLKENMDLIDEKIQELC